MAFFDSIGKTISEKGQVAVKKTKDFAEVTKINSLISDEERNINNNYFQIGKLYASMYSTDYGEEFKAFITSIKESEAKIVDYREKIQLIRGTVKCEKCGGEVSIESAFCNFCGSPMPKRVIEKKDENMVVCSNCGGTVKTGMRFCTHCGNAMPQKVSSTSVPLIMVCPNCGFETDEEEIRFCNSCGTKMVEKQGNSEVAPTIKSDVIIKKCPKCGFSTEDNELLFCTECGTKFE